jgi:hypothetical protein
VKTTRAYAAGAVLGATLVSAVWLFTYRTWETNLIRDPHGVVVVATVGVRVQPWWAVLGELILPLIGVGLSLWLLPEGRRLIERFFSRLGGAFSAKPS